ncbi:zinc protease, partial [Candidatus Gastranaerophilus sp. (ex Termes propinquus)]
MNEVDEKRGISHFIEHNLFNGSEGLAPGQFFKDVTKMGAQTNASTNYAQTDYYISSSFLDDKDLKKTVEMHADMILRPLFCEDMLEKEKGPVTSEISMVNDSIASLAVNEVVRNLYQIDSASDNLVAGSISTVNSITKEDVLEYWQRHYTPDNMYTVLVGDVNPDEAIGLIAKNFNQKPVARERTAEVLTPRTTPARVDFKSQVDNASSVVAAFSGPTAQSTRDKIALEALGLLLLGNNSSRLSSELHKINSYGGFDSERVGLRQEDPVALFFQIITPKGNQQKGIDTLYKVLEDVKVNPPTHDEMQVVKNSLNKYLAMCYESSEAICDTIGSSFLNQDFWSVSQYQNIINALTPADLSAVAQKYLDLNKVSLGVVHAQGTTDEDIAKSFKQSPYSLKAQNNLQTGCVKNISFTGTKPISVDSVKQMRLKDNNQVFLSNSSSDICYFNWKLTSHSSVPKNPAVPYVLTTILNHSTENSSDGEFAKRANLLGVDFGMDANGFAIVARADSLSNTSVEAVKMLQEAILSPNLTQAEFNAAKKKVYEHFASANKDASSGLVSELYPQYFADIPQILDGLKRLSLNDVKSHWAHLVNNASSNFVISAPFSKNDGLEASMLNAIALKSGEWKSPQMNLVNVHQPTREAQVFVDTEERNQAQVFKTYSFKMSGNIQDEVKFELMNTILGGSPASRLFSDLRENEKLAYRVASSIQSFGDTGIVTMYTLTTTDDKAQGDIKYDNLSKSLNGFERHAKKLQNELVTDEELESAKMILKQNIHSEFEMPYSKVELPAMSAEQPYGIKRIDEYYNMIDKIT